MSLRFTKSKRFSLGVELELQLLDRESLDLKPVSPAILSRISDNVKSGKDRAEQCERIKAEIFQSMIEINTGICPTPVAAVADLSETVRLLSPYCDEAGVSLASAGSHPFALYTERRLFPASRYEMLIDRNQWIARRLMIFGLHVHVGMKNGEECIRFLNGLAHWQPVLLALSASSPYWHSDDTGLASSRITFFEAIPTGGHPCWVRDWKEFQSLYSRLIRTQAITSIKDIWWDLRPSPHFGTLEVRICDCPPTLREVEVLVGLIHTLCLIFDREWGASAMKTPRRGKFSRKRGWPPVLFSPPQDWIMRENKWRASRHGLDARLIMDPKGEGRRGGTRLLREFLDELFSDRDFLDVAAESSGTAGVPEWVAFARGLLSRGVSYERQRRVYDRSGSFQDVARHLAREFRDNEPDWINPRRDPP